MGDEGCPQRQLPAQAVGKENMDTRMKRLLDLLKRYTLAIFIGQLLLMELRDGVITPQMLGFAAACTLATAGMCGLSILVMRKAHIV